MAWCVGGLGYTHCGGAVMFVADVPRLSHRRSFDPLMVSYSPLKYNKYMMSAAMLSNDQSSIGPIRRMQVR